MKKPFRVEAYVSSYADAALCDAVRNIELARGGVGSSRGSVCEALSDLLMARLGFGQVAALQLAESLLMREAARRWCESYVSGMHSRMERAVRKRQGASAVKKAKKKAKRKSR